MRLTIIKPKNNASVFTARMYVQGLGKSDHALAGAAAKVLNSSPLTIPK